MTLIRLNLDLIENELVEVKDQNSHTIDLIKYVRRAITGVDKVKNIINFSLDDQYNIHLKESFGVKRELFNMARVFEMRLINEQVKLHISVLSDFKITGLRQAFQRVISNLITNSLDAFNERNIPGTKGIENIQKKNIMITAFFSGDHYVISVEDNAGGIPMQIQKYLFKQQYTTKASGQGIGLISIKRLVEKHFGGFIRCYSIKNKGTLFAMAIPKK